MIYTISIGSGTRVAGTAVNNANYNIDWSILPEGKSFKVGFSFVSATVNVTSYTSICLLQTDLGGTDTYRISSTGSTYTISTSTVGILIPHTLSTTTFLKGEAQANNKVFIKSRPNNNVLNIRLFTPTGAFWTDNVAVIPSSYVLILSLEEMD